MIKLTQRFSGNNALWVAPDCIASIRPTTSGYTGQIDGSEIRVKNVDESYKVVESPDYILVLMNRYRKGI